jgi:hypothetical protein
MLAQVMHIFWATTKKRSSIAKRSFALSDLNRHLIPSFMFDDIKFDIGNVVKNFERSHKQ